MIDLDATITRLRAAKAEGARLRAFRRSQGWTQYHLAQQLGLHPNTVARLERGERKITKQTWRLVEQLGGAS